MGHGREVEAGERIERGLVSVVRQVLLEMRIATCGPGVGSA